MTCFLKMYKKSLLTSIGLYFSNNLKKYHFALDSCYYFTGIVQILSFDYKAVQEN